MRYIPYKPPTTKIAGDEYEIMPTECSILIQRRMELGMTATQVAENANITLAQYQRFETGKRNFTSASARMFLAVCAVLRLDPYTFFPLSTIVKNYQEYEDQEENPMAYISSLMERLNFDDVSFQEYKELLLKVPKGKLVTRNMIEEYFKKKKNLDTVRINSYNIHEYLTKSYPFWRVVSETGTLTLTTRFYSRDVQREMLEQEGFEIYECGAKGASLRVKNFKDYLFDLNTLF